MATVSLQLNTVDNNGPYLLTNVSVGGGQTVSVIVDTGSSGFILPPQDISLGNLGPITGSGSVTYGASPFTRTYYYNTYTTTVNFGNGIVTAPTTVDVVTGGIDNNTGIPIPAAQALPTMGIGLINGLEPGTGVVTASLPGTLGQGVLINATTINSAGQGGSLQFGSNPLPVYTSVSGAPIPTDGLDIVVSNSFGTDSVLNYSSYIDSGGILGVVPQNLVPGGALGQDVPAGTTITVYTGSGTELYQFTYPVDTDLSPFVSGSGGDFNTGMWPFFEYPTYLSYSPTGTGTLTFDN